MMKIPLYLFLLFTLFACDKASEPKNGINPELKKELAKIWFKDQAIRLMTDKTSNDTINRLAKLTGFDPVYLKNNYKSVMVQIDSENQKRIEEIIAKHSYPGKNQVGTPENETAWLIIQHSDPKMIEKYLPMLREAAQKGDISKQSLALTEDRNLMYHGKNQIYGSQSATVEGKTIIWPIQDPKNVNELRKEAGFLQTVEEYAKMVHGKDFNYEVFSLEDIGLKAENK